MTSATDLSLVRSVCDALGTLPLTFPDEYHPPPSLIPGKVRVFPVRRHSRCLPSTPADLFDVQIELLPPPERKQDTVVAASGTPLSSLSPPRILLTIATRRLVAQSEFQVSQAFILALSQHLSRRPDLRPQIPHLRIHSDRRPRILSPSIAEGQSTSRYQTSEGLRRPRRSNHHNHEQARASARRRADHS